MARGRSLLVSLALALAIASCATPAAPTRPAPMGTTAGPSPAAAATGTPAASSVPSPTDAGTQPAVSPSPTAGEQTAPLPAQEPAEGSAPALALALELPWEPVYAGDPLRVVVQLSSPRAMDALYAQYLALEAGQPTPALAFASPAVAADWAQGVTLALYRLEAGGTRTPVLAPGDWAGYRRRPEESEDVAFGPSLAWAQEWLVPAEAAGLEAGDYVLEAAWDGRGLADGALLGADGALQAQALSVTVQAPENWDQATHLGRLANVAFLQGDNARARTLGQEALDTGLDDGSPERLNLYFLVAAACFGQQDYQAAIATYKRVIARVPAGSELALLAQQWIDMIEDLQQGP